MLSMANDDMIRLCMMYPATFFFDVTGGTNNMKRNVFIMCTKDSSENVLLQTLLSYLLKDPGCS